MKQLQLFQISSLAAMAFVLSESYLNAQIPTFKAEVVDNQIDIGYGLAIGDVDGDGRPDILLADKTEIVWYQNPGGRNKPWHRYVMAKNLTEFDNVCIAARDIDGDGRVEVAVGAQWNPAETKDATKSGAVFYLKKGEDVKQLWEPVRLHHEVTIHRMQWGKTPSGTFQLLVLPLHGKNNVNGEGEGVKWIAFDAPAQTGEAWKYQLLDTEMHLTHNFQVLEEAGKSLKAAIGGKEGVRLFEYKGKAWVPTTQWLVKDHPVGEVQTGMLKRKGNFTATVEPMHGTHVMVTFDGKARNELTGDYMQGHALGVGDLLGRGEDQVVAGWRNPNKNKEVGVRLYVAEENGWKEYSLDDRIRMACEDLKLADLDGDLKLDVVAAGRATLNVLIYWNDSK
jgi:hypothetical protein